jgi:flagellin-like protein
MHFAPHVASPRGGASLKRSKSRRWKRGRRGVAEVVATIILLALTVVLFSAIFAFVTTFPSPPAQSNNQFQASLTYVTSGTTTSVSALKILHLAGPAVQSSALVYIKSAADPGGSEFLNPYSLAQGNITTTTWNLGQTWMYTFPSTARPALPDNFTIYVVSSDAVLFSVILPGQSFIFPATFVATSVTPFSPNIGAQFNISATIAGSVVKGSVFVNLGGIWGFNGTTSHPSPIWQMSYSTSAQAYYLLVTSAYGASTVAGTYYAFVNATSSNGQSALASVAVTIAGGSTTVTAPTLALSPVQDPYVNSITATGAGFAGTTSVVLTFNGPTLTLNSCSSGTLAASGTSVTTTAAGGFVCSFSLPTLPSGTYTVFASGLTSGQTATALFLLTTPTVTSPTSGSTLTPGTTKAVTGTGFTVSSTVLIKLSYTATSGATNATPTCTAGSTTTTATGTFSCSITVPTPKTGSTAATFWVEDISTGRWVGVSVTL